MTVGPTSQLTYSKLDLLKLMYLSREGDRREGVLLRQSKGWFHVGAMGHESLGVLQELLRDDDYLFGYYRERATVLARGVSNQDLALAYFAKRNSSSGGRQMPGHYSSRDRNIWSVPTPTSACLLPACGAAWAMQLEHKDSVVVGTTGDAATRQGEFFEAVTFAVQLRLPIIFLVEDNLYGISTPTRDMNPLRMNIFGDGIPIVEVDGRHPDNVLNAAAPAFDRARRGEGPTILHCELDRLCDHTSSDDQRVYRSADELAAMAERDPIKVVANELIQSGEITAEAWEQIKNTIEDQVDSEYIEAQAAADPRPAELLDQLYGPLPSAQPPPLEGGRKWRMVDAINHVFRQALEKDDRYVFFGQDIADPKGGVFGLTKGLSTAHPDRVFNSPLAEATIVGVACGMANYGMRPVFELQFIDFLGPAWNQFSQNLATIRWRSFGEWPCPCVIYAPYGGYLPGGSIWHSQANESLFAHVPGLRVVVPGTPEDAAGLMWTAMHADDPTIVLLPKHRFRQQFDVEAPVEAVPFGKAIVRIPGDDVTIVAWGNCIEQACEAAEQIAGEASVEVIDLRSLVPWDRECVRASLEKTGRLIVVQEDARSCSVGQMLISDVTSDPDTWDTFLSPPQLVSRDDVHIGFNPIYEYAALPSTDDVIAAVRRVMSE
ncbi:MAG TPA: thiamine pyrophosphate-dependent enzyme [Pirellulales bacterium]|nr:thiamine pyrophosphate-dependent enzyme [Pirellulales bacterium]